MRFIEPLFLASTTTAFSFPDISQISSIFARKAGNGQCPDAWNSISKDLTAKFLSNGQCNPDARAAIRLVFHDCGAWNQDQGAKGGCDGSIILAPGELQRNENKGLENIAGYVQSLAQKYSVGVADAIIFAGNHATVTCPGGPRVRTFVGRTDSKTPAPEGLLPDVNAPAASLLQLFQDKGFSARDLAALLGAHTTSNQFNTDKSKSGYPQDSTPGVWDVKYYGETLKNTTSGVYVLPSDAKLSRYGEVGREFQGFVNNQRKWTGMYADAMARMELHGSSGTSGMIDCTDSLPRPTNVKREMKALPVFRPRN